MSSERLTRQEISWLLAQEARGAARALREGVTQLKQPGPKIAFTADPAVETTLDALDDAISKLSELQTGAPGKGARRGRIDLAALLYEIAPTARISIEPGAGTEVFGEDGDLRRMLHVLLSQTHADPAVPSGSASPEVQIRRQDEWVRISVELGPDTSATMDLERRWLSRMAVRHGGRLELEGGMQTILLPADGASDQREVVELRKELEQAQQLGEAYARELAAVFAAGDMPVGRSEPPGADVASERFGMLVSAAAALAREARALVDGLRVDSTFASETLGENAELTKRLARRTATAAERTVELMRIGECDPAAPSSAVDVVKLVRQAAEDAEGRASRRGVSIETRLGTVDALEASQPMLDLAVRSLIDHAIAATQRGGTVVVHVESSGGGVHLAVEDGGPLVPESAWEDVIQHRVDPAGLGRPGGLALLAAETAVAALGGQLRMRQSASGRSEIWVRLPA